MKKHLLSAFSLLLVGTLVSAQEVAFEEYDLDNGLHVILHQDNSAPVVTVSVMYHVGSKDEDPQKTGFAHFFEHLLFEGTENIARGEWDQITAANGGRNNANTFLDRTYYYEVFPSNSLEVGLWLESERMMHPIIGQVGVDTQKEVVQEERRLRVDNSPYGAFFEQLLKNLYTKHPYRWAVIGSLDHLASATLDDFKKFNKTYYVPNNAVLIVAGDIDSEKTKKMVTDYFGPIPKGADIKRPDIKEDPITQTIYAKYHDPNIQIPAILLAYRTPGQGQRDAYVINMISTYLSDGESSKLYKKLVDEKKMALQVISVPIDAEDYSSYVVGALPVGENSIQDLKKEIDEEILKLQMELISEKDYQKLQNKFENMYVNANSSVEGIANNLAEDYLLKDNTNLINTEIDIYRSITREEIMEVAKKYLKVNQRVELEYLPEQKDAN
ncbi:MULTISPECIES: M16 family metallopeptidase [Flagellimonas]|uniref:Insulinase family protein n=2 Tax=Flagellimonas TaxID=444459 RepID=A0A3A1NH89_9FLAO|nr:MULTISPECIES: pitrilysin family protein [Allomuricauda]RIV44065.1 insulinase family protein [Allomuricauda maritima]RIV70720.1 insulinase family protein [Allomuricauda aequoris]TXJ93968.1 insulinase family protein [Allomuricauda maritima]TXK02159.1 insulinase family protein [Allomuricauda aequoris]